MTGMSALLVPPLPRLSFDQLAKKKGRWRVHEVSIGRAVSWSGGVLVGSPRDVSGESALVLTGSASRSWR